MSVTAPDQGTASIVGAGHRQKVLYTPPTASFVGDAHFQYTIADLCGATATGNVTVTVRVPPPRRGRHHQDTVADDAAVACSGGPVTINVLANDRIGKNDPITALTISQAPDPALGTAVVNPDNTITFTPAAGATSQATFQYQLCFQETGHHHTVTTECLTAMVTVVLRDTDQPPTATDDTATTLQNIPVKIGVLANDSDPDTGAPGGDKLTITGVTVPDQGTAAVLSSKQGQQILYTPPDATFAGDAHFQYTVTDVCGTTATANVAVTVQLPPPPAQVLLVNNSNFQIGVIINGSLIDVLQPNGATVVPANVAAGANEKVRVEALLRLPHRARNTTARFNFDSGVQYTITYTDDNSNPATITRTP